MGSGSRKGKESTHFRLERKFIGGYTATCGRHDEKRFGFTDLIIHSNTLPLHM
jgi:hypothetical protein